MFLKVGSLSVFHSLPFLKLGNPPKVLLPTAAQPGPKGLIYVHEKEKAVCSLLSQKAEQTFHASVSQVGPVSKPLVVFLCQAVSNASLQKLLLPMSVEVQPKPKWPLNQQPVKFLLFDEMI